MREPSPVSRPPLPTPLPAVALVETRAATATGELRVLVRGDRDDAALRSALADPAPLLDQAPRTDAKNQRRARRKRLVGKVRLATGRGPADCFVKLFRLRSLKDRLEELALGKRALRSLRAGLEAERRGVPVALHLGASLPVGAERWPGPSALLLEALPTRRDAIDALRVDLAERGRKRRRFLKALGAFCAAAHERGLVHGDLKAGNVIALDLDPPRFAFIDLDRASFREARPSIGLRDVVELVRLLRSLRRGTSRRERRALLAAYRGARDGARGPAGGIVLAAAMRLART